MGKLLAICFLTFHFQISGSCWISTIGKGFVKQLFKGKSCNIFLFYINNSCNIRCPLSTINHGKIYFLNYNNDKKHKDIKDHRKSTFYQNSKKFLKCLNSDH